MHTADRQSPPLSISLSLYPPVTQQVRHSVSQSSDAADDG